MPSALTPVRSSPRCSWAARASGDGRVRMPRRPAMVLPGSETTVKARLCFCCMVSDPSGFCGLIATSGMPRSVSCGSSCVLVGGQGDVAVRAPGAPVEDQDRRAAPGCGVQGGGGSVHVEQLRVGQDGPDRGDGGWRAGRQLGLFAGEGAHGLGGRVGRHRGVHLCDALGDRGRAGHCWAPAASGGRAAGRRSLRGVRHARASSYLRWQNRMPNPQALDRNRGVVPGTEWVGAVL